jgi:DNA polymerase elongation subunit (family B)
VSNKTEPKIILWDLETLPNLDEAMKVFPSISDYPGLTLKASINSIICFGYKTFGDGPTRVLNAWDYKGWAKSVNDDRELVMAAYDILKEADAVITHNGKRFDWKFLQTRLLKYGFPPLPKILHIDTCSESKKNLLMFNNRLNTLAKFMTSEQKLENGGWQLWDRVRQREPKAMRTMSAYCKQDVETLNALFKKLRPRINNIPNYNMLRTTDNFVCPRCGSTRIQSRGKGLNKNFEYYKFQCQDCGGWFSSKHKDKEPRAT